MEVSNKITGMIAVIIVTIVALGCTPVIVDQVQATLAAAEDPDTEWNFTGAEGAKALLGLVPFIWVASILVMAAVGMFVVAKSGNGGG